VRALPLGTDGRVAEADLRALDAASAQPAVLAELRAAHLLELEAERDCVRGELETSFGFDNLLAAETGAFNLLLENRRHPRFPAERVLALRAALGRALATVAPAELLGFEPHAGVLADPLADPARLALLRQIQQARLDIAHKELNRLFERMLRQGLRSSAEIEPDDEERMLELRREIESLQEVLLAGEEQGWRPLLELRVPSTSALWLARELRDEGKSGEARAVAERLRADLARGETSAKFIWGLEIEAEIEMLIGSSYTDEDQPQRAQVELAKAAERLQAIEDLMRERGAGAAELVRVRALRANALVSLAVNANVKLGEPERALVYFEQAFALRQDDFMRVLLACYRARAGRADEARALLREVTPAPGTLYNTACTWALLGERELALEFLRRELEENQPSPAGLAKQREWARKDPDLRALRGDPRFEALVGR
jgi:tetratricopeptide (TPR) repeat protein